MANSEVAAKRLANKVALVTGAAQGVGRAHILKFAEHGAAIIACDAQPVAEGAFKDTIEDAKAMGARIAPFQIDVRDLAGLAAAAENGASQLGGLHIVVANAGIMAAPGLLGQLSEDAWRTTLDVNLTGVWHTINAAAPIMRRQGLGGAIIIVNSIWGFKGGLAIAHYTASKHGALGLMKSMALELGSERIRVNAVNPTSVDTPMLRSVLPDLEERAAELSKMHALPAPVIEASDVANASLFLASDEARFITGVSLPIDAGALIK